MESTLQEEFVSSPAFPLTPGRPPNRPLASTQLIDRQSLPGRPGGEQTRKACVWHLKRTLDFFLAAIALILAAPLLLLAAISIKLDSPGPVLYRQRRLGFRECPFELLKLRSMHVESTPSADEGRWTQVDDPRVTRVGKVLRRYRIDELPQLWNVLRGEMSLVGPRPEQVPIATRLAAIAPDYRFRHLVRPGITGWAQVNAGYCASDNASMKKLAYDLYYVSRMSLLLDIQIVCRTVAVVLTGHGAR